jgi:hypothetical protein
MRLRLSSLFERKNRSRHALAVTDAAFAANLDFKDGLGETFIERDLHVTELKPPSFIRPDASVDHEQDEVVELFALPFVSDLARFLLDATRK